ncbi:substrate-binding domain-containing protein [Haloimpatiens massiliensis]|uniref:sugar ABC transporter substrate-binding protein n=1 Tax=Haloimpatiens massiliensis TaxID=1658110 RepID=UPI000C830079|nr:substrate-binding domain-containing protein [Haloimpatiens massiliensis]
MKKLITLFLAIFMSLSVVGCGNNNESKKNTSSEKKSTVQNNNSSNKNSSTKDNAILKQMEEDLTKQLGSLPTKGKNEKIGVLIISLTNPFWVNMKECYENAGKNLGITVEVLTGTTEGDKASQLETLMTMATKDYDAIIVSPIEGTNLNPGIVKCNQNGIPVINLGPGVDTEALKKLGGKLDGKITVDFKEQGEMVAKDMVSRMGGSGEVAILQGLAGAGQSEGRTLGAKEYFQSKKDVKLVATQPCNWDANLAFDATKAIIQANPKLKGIFACNDVMALAATEALKSIGRNDVLVYGVDFTKDAKASIKEGTMMASVTYSSQVYTKAALLMAMKAAQGHKLSKAVYSPLTLVTQDNIKDYENWK